MNAKTYLLFVATLAVFFGLIAAYIKVEMKASARDLPREAIEDVTGDLKEKIEDFTRVDLDDLKRKVPTIRPTSNEPKDAPRPKPGKKERERLEDLDIGSLAEQSAATVFKIFGDVTDEIIGLTPEEELSFGERFHQEMIANQKVHRDPQLMRRIIGLTEPFLAYTAQDHLDYRVYVLETNAFNAVTIVGGYIYVYTGLLEKCQGNDDALKFIIGHEIAHNELRHCAKRTAPIVRAGELGGASGSEASRILYNLISAGYSEMNELDADEWSYKAMRDMGHSKTEALAGARLLAEHAPSDSSKQKPGVINTVESWFGTHPSSEDRLAYLKTLN